ncbi:MAG: hypothetical protein ACK5HY_10525 [Parahaliea sp.]
MAAWKDLLIDTLKLTDEGKRLSDKTERLSDRTIDLGRRLVRIETMVDMTQGGGFNKKIDPPKG